VIDAAGAIYVIGGYSSGNTDFQDVWASTDGGARAGPGRRGWSGGSREGTQVGYEGVLCSIGILRST
jgi:hypothetical protein